MIDWSKSIRSADRVKASKNAKMVAIKARRDSAIDSIIFVSGVPIGTDNVTQTRLMGATMAAVLDPDYSVQWKAADNTFYELNAKEITGVANAVRAHVQACFNREAVLLSALQFDQPAALDEGWPTNKVRLSEGHAVAVRVGPGVFRVETSAPQWDVVAPEGYVINVSHDGFALTVWAWKNGMLSDLDNDQYIELRSVSEE